MQRPGKMVEVEWIDTTTAHGWTPTQQAVTDDLDCLLIGYEIARSETTVTFVFGAGEDQMMCPMTIPLVNIKAIHPLRR